MSYRYAAQCKILLVDDSPELLRILERMLTAEGYPVQTATSRYEALERLGAERFHVAVIDVRLNDRDPFNHDGMRLMRDTRRLDPSTGIILLTTPADLDIVREALYSASGEMHPVFEVSRAPASAYLEKTPEALRWLPNYVRTVFEDVVRVNGALRIVDMEQFMVLIPRRMRFSRSPQPDVPEVQIELEELMRKLFAEWDKIEIRTIAEQNLGNSRAFVFQVTPYIHDDPGKVLIAKVGEHSAIAREVRRYREFMERHAQGSRSPSAISPVRRTRNLGGMVYSFEGLEGNIRDFAQFYHGAKDDRQMVGDVIANLFITALTKERGGKRVMRQSVDLRSVYASLLRLDARELQEKQDELMVIARSVGQSALSEKFWISPEHPLVNPVEYALVGNFSGSYVETTLHGGLHTHNVLVDPCNDAWLIDFANTCRGPLLQDYIAFEASLLIEANEYPPGRQLYEWTRAMFAQPGELFPRLPEKWANIPELAKTHHAVLTLRHLAYHELRREQAARTYLIGLFFTSLRMMTVKFLTPPKRFHALTLASVLAENLMALETSA